MVAAVIALRMAVSRWYGDDTDVNCDGRVTAVDALTIMQVVWWLGAGVVSTLLLIRVSRLLLLV